MAMNKKCSSGRQKIPIEKIPKKSNLQVTFSKRRSGLFKKASELCTLCGVEIAIIVFSPANKAFSFGHPGVESIIDRYLVSRKSSHHADHGYSSSSSSIISSSDVHRNSNVCNLNMQLTQILNQVDMEKKRGEELDRARKVRQREFWWESPIDELDSVDQLQQLRIAMEDLKKDVLRQNRTFSTSCSSSSQIIVGEDYGLFERYDDVVFDKKLLLGGAEINVAANSSGVIPDHDAFNNLIYQNHDMGIFKFTSQF
ncbi:agamous-like MADS-box protein AGL61 [Prosopis cineraria]|uniref:agamous-like MADS-box protein AGL61 n=1 Tax=Prosopis cineraria TaxID=364024 RepID=UPI002410414B|nr:agamous-like MADS-box protein AGL61 [Prosopis cineraria]